MQTKKYRKHIILALSIALLFLIIEVLLFWNGFARNKDVGLWPFIFALLIVFAIGYALNIGLKATNTSIIREEIDKEVNNEHIRIIKEYEKKEETEKTIDNKEIIDKKVSDIIPKGNFKNIDSLLAKYLKNLANELEIAQGIIYLKDNKTDEYKFLSGYALTSEENITGFKAGESLPGQVAISSEISYLTDIPEEYFKIESGLGKAHPRQLIFAPVNNNKEVVAIFELAAFRPIENLNKEILEQSLKDISTKVEQTIKS